jgi:hypothetical protein
MTKRSTQFELQFSLAEVPTLAARYDFLDDTNVMRIGEGAGLRGYFTKPEFLYVCEWKTQRSKSRVKQNSVNEIVEATHVALTADSEVLRIWSPMALYGVAWARHQSCSTWPIQTLTRFSIFGRSNHLASQTQWFQR